jgi:hypothetical protein
MKKSIDRATQYVIEKTAAKGQETIWDRSEQQHPRCGFGELGICCHNCYMGPCRINPKGKEPQKGVCGASPEVIVARNFARMIAAGAAAHSDHGIMIVYRDYPDMTPIGMKFSTLAGSVGGGVQTPGFIGHSKFYIGSRKFISAEGGAPRIVWMSQALKKEMEPILREIGEREGISNFYDMIADETVATTEEEVLEYITKKNHPALSMPSMF